MADVQVGRKEATKAEGGREGAEDAVSRTGTKGAMEQRADAACGTAMAHEEGRDEGRSKATGRPATGGTGGSAATRRSARAGGAAKTAARRSGLRVARRSWWARGDKIAMSLLEETASGRGTGVKLLLAELSKRKPRKEPVKKPRRMNWARRWAAEPEWKAPEEGS